MTLADSSAGVIECANYAFGRLALPLADRDKIRRTIGLPLDRTFSMLQPQGNARKAQEFARLFVERANRCMAELTIIFPEVAPQILWLRANGCATAIVSTKFRYRIDDILARNQLTSLFDVVVGGEDIARHKPDPSGLLLALGRLGVAAVDAVYVGDHPVDKEAASRAGVRFVAVLTGSSTAAEFLGDDELKILSSIGDLKFAIEGVRFQR
jgi:phosphoglycolate phosphatase